MQSFHSIVLTFIQGVIWVHLFSMFCILIYCIIDRGIYIYIILACMRFMGVLFSLVLLWIAL